MDYEILIPDTDRERKIKGYQLKNGKLSDKTVKKNIPVRMYPGEMEVIGEVYYGANHDGFLKYGDFRIPYRLKEGRKNQDGKAVDDYSYYLCLDDGKAIGVTDKENLIALLIGILFSAIVVPLMIHYYPPVWDIPQDNKPDVHIGDYSAIGGYQPEIEEEETQSSMAYISGSSVISVSEKARYVELKNIAQNEEYLFSYKVKIDDDIIYETDGLIPAGKEALWDAWNCENIKTGTNLIDYDIDIYDYEGNKLSTAFVEGITIIKK